MKSKAVRLYGKQDLRLEEMILPDIDDDGVQVKVISDSLCMSSYKASLEKTFSGCCSKRSKISYSWGVRAISSPQTVTLLLSVVSIKFL